MTIWRLWGATDTRAMRLDLRLSPSPRPSYGRKQTGNEFSCLTIPTTPQRFYEQAILTAEHLEVITRSYGSGGYTP